MKKMAMPSLARRGGLFIFLLLLLALTWTGCMPSSYRMGMSCLRGGQYDDAVRYFEQAKNSAGSMHKDECREKLEEAKQKAAASHLREAREAYRQARLSDAINEIELCLKYSPAYSVRNEAAALRKKIRNRRAQAADAKEKAFRLANEKEWDEAIAEMEHALELDRTLPEGKASLRELQTRAHDHTVDRARKALENDDRSQALRLAEQAQERLPESQALQEIKKQVGDHEQAEELIREAGNLAADREHARALEKLEKASDLHPGREGIDQKITSVRKDYCDTLIEKGNSHLEAGEHENALQAFKKCYKIRPAHAGIEDWMQKARGALVEMHIASAQRYMEEGLPGNALMQYLVVLGLDEGNTQARRGVPTCSEAISERTRYRVGVAGFDVVQGKEASADRLESVTLNHLSMVKPPNVSILERRDVDKILEELDLRLSELATEETRIDEARIQGADALLVGKYLGCQINESRSHTKKASKYQDGFEQQPNPEYSRAQSRLRQAQERRERAQNRVASTETQLRIAHESDAGDFLIGLLEEKLRHARSDLENARAEVHSAQRELETTQQFVRKPRMVEHQYPVFQVTQKAELNITIKLVDTMIGEVISVSHVKGSAQASDRHVKENPERNVPSDPLELPDESTMRQRAISDALPDLRQFVEMAVYKHGHRFAVKARRAADAGKDELAVEHALSYLFAYPVSNPDSGKMVLRLRKALPHQQTSLDLEELLARHCHVLLEPGRLPAKIRESDGSIIIEQFRGVDTPSGVEPPCMLTGIEGNIVRSKKAVDAVLTHYGAGDEVTLNLTQHGRSLNIEVKLVPASPE